MCNSLFQYLFIRYWAWVWIVFLAILTLLFEDAISDFNFPCCSCSVSNSEIINLGTQSRPWERHLRTTCNLWAIDHLFIKFVIGYFRFVTGVLEKLISFLYQYWVFFCLDKVITSILRSKWLMTRYLSSCLAYLFISICWIILSYKIHIASLEKNSFL